jgi:formamidopyrimidine-DNA glycosylase
MPTTMPELPDITIYVERLRALVVGQPLVGVRVASPFVLRSVHPPVQNVVSQRVRSVERLGKRIVIALESDLFLVIHLMIAGRLRWRDVGTAIPAKVGLAAFDFPNGSLLFTEAGAKKRASLHVVSGREQLRQHDRGGVEPLTCSRDEFCIALMSQNRTLKRILTDPTVFSGIGNAYSDEILHAARLSPLQLTRNLDETEVDALFSATKTTLELWVQRLRDEVGDGFPDKVTAFREGMVVHGRFGQACSTCGSQIQRIVYARNEMNYCARCQTEGRLLADRAFSRLLRADWPKTIEEWEEGKRR